MLSSTSSGVKAWSIYSLPLLLFIVCLFQVCQVHHLKQKVNERKSQVNLLRRENTSSPRQLSNSDSNITIYGHSHVAKTGGTSLNGILSNKYERVCGNKGYSYDAYQANERAKAYVEKTGELFYIGKKDQTTTKFDRDRIKPSIMREIGWEDCDYVSLEHHGHAWGAFSDNIFKDFNFELHVACRDPIDHILSMCNMIHHIIPCDLPDEELFALLNRCAHATQTNKRFDKKAFDEFGYTVKCFDFRKQFTDYIDYMGEKLDHKRMVSEPYIKRESNEPRDKDSECLLKDPELQEKVKTWLFENYDYWAYCDSCLGSENDLLLGWGAEDTY